VNALIVERVGVRGFAFSIDLPRSPDALSRVDISPWER
jgi:hypothetical protein